MTTMSWRPTVLGAALLLAGCASMHQAAAPTAFVRPLTRIEDASTKPAPDSALAERRARDCDALAVAQARRGDYAAAQRLLEEAIGLVGNRAALYNDLGYVRLLAGDADGAVAALTQALRIDPRDTHARANLASARVALARTAPTPGVAATVALVPAGPGVLALRPLAPAATPAPARQQPAPRQPAALVSLTPVAVAPVTRLAPINATLEVSNGNGVTGMAARVARRLDASGIPVRRLSNSRPFTQPTTRIDYRPGWEAAAQRLRLALPGEVTVTASRTLRADIDLRLLLGRDLRSGAGHVAAAPGVSPG